ncbi:MAG: UDP-3-O-(3-hydroxymyristoyl)glucosamine N-acyltransferase [Flavobacteriales bacterium]|jgi:UDP-3-O-[3-hydroxymyristoyl] glucosamine N-acyltransferase|nr:UDP-3-O-(3-hydroxymyristoyl)glucosamine N-acyltransferase [Flavobacteriales bacterium]
MVVSAKQIAEVLGGVVEGDPLVEVNSVASIEDGKEQALSFLSNPKYNQFLYNTKSSVIIINKDLELEKEVPNTLIRVEDAYMAFAQLLKFIADLVEPKVGIEQPVYMSDTAQYGEHVYLGAFSYIGKNVKIGDNVQIYPHTYIGDDVTIGDDSIVYAGVKIYHKTQIGKDCTIHAGAVIGADGFGFAPTNDQDYNKVPQIGNVIIEDYVEIGANTTIDRATFGSTVIKKGTKLDNLIQIAHNVVLGENNVIAAQTGIAGSTKVGDNCMIGGQVAIAGHIEIGNEVKIAAKSGVPSSISDGEIHMGPVAFERREFQRSYILFKKLPSLFKNQRNIEKQLKNLFDQ